MEKVIYLLWVEGSFMKPLFRAAGTGIFIIIA